MTDNKNRTVSEVRHVFEKYNGNLGQQGCVSWMFTRKGVILVPQSAIGEDELMEIVLENGAEDMVKEGNSYEITTTTEDFDKVREALKAKKLPIESAEIAKVPSTYIKLEGGRPNRCSSCTTSWRNWTTSRTSGPTSTSPTRK